MQTISLVALKGSKLTVDTLISCQWIELSRYLKVIDRSKYNEFRDYVLINVLLDSMARIQETLNLKISDVDFGRQVLTFRHTKNRQTRVVPVSKHSLKLISELIKENEEFDTDYIFLSVTGTPIEKSAREISTKLKTYAARAGISKRVHFYQFRHTAASYFLEKSKNIRLLQKLLGHSDISVTQVYAHVLDKHVFRAVQDCSILNNLHTKRKLKKEEI